MTVQTKRILSMVLALCLCIAMLPPLAIIAEAATYDVSKAMTYANTHWNDGKGLCAEFVSDCLAAGGVTIPNSASYYSSSTQSYNNNSGTLGVYTNPYTCSASLLLYLSTHYTVITNPTSDQIAVGDVVFMYSGDGKWRDGHVGIVISTTGGTPVYAAHNRATNSGKFHSNYPCTYVVKMSGQIAPHTCDKGTYVFVEELHPHYKCYRCSICGSVWRNTAEPTTVSSCASCTPKRTIDNRYASFFPIAAYPLSTGHISVYDASGAVYSNRYIDGATDLCIIWEIYTDGWCKVRYPSSAEASGYFDAYVPLSAFTIASSPSSWTTPNEYTTYKRSDLGSTMHNVSSGASCLLLNTNGSVKQIIHPVSGVEYSMMGWIDDKVSAIPAKPIVTAEENVYAAGKNITVSWNAVAGNEFYWISVYRDEELIIGQSANQATSYTLQSATEGKYVFWVSANNSAGTSGPNSCSFTVGVYTLSYNANGGTGAPAAQVKCYKESLKLSDTKPIRTGYTFLGWATSANAATAEYQPGDTFTANANTTLYAVWKKDIVTLNKIEITTLPIQTSYEIGESLDTTGLKIKATYSDGSTQTITSGFAVSGFDSSTAGEKTVTVTYSGKSTSFRVTVEESEEVDPDTPMIIVENVTATAGDTVAVTVKIENNPGVAYTKLKIGYREELELMYVENQGVLTGTFTTSESINVKPYVVQWMGAENATNNGCFLVLTFKVPDNVAAGSYSITITCEEAYNDTFEDVRFAITNGIVTACDYMPGDVNDDGKVNGKDGILLAQYLAEWNVTINMNAADVNGDGKINGKDGILLAQYLAEWDVELS